MRENITFGLEFDEDFYKQVLRACNLEDDLDQLEHGDQTIVGERGVTLSGGQKARLSLARALYSRSDIYLLDDPLSAVDAKVANHIFEKAIRGMLKDKTVILVTHHLGFAKQADNVIVLDQGKIQAEGSFDEVSGKRVNLLAMFTNDEHDSVEQQKRKASVKQEKPVKEIKLNNRRQRGKDDINREVTWATYKNYFSTCLTPWKGILAIVFFVCVHCSVVALTRLLGYWASDQIETYYISQETNTPYVFVHRPYVIAASCLVCFIVLGIYAKGQLLTQFILEINTNLHTRLVDVISRAQVQFFDETPVGQILSRFSTSLATLDRQQPHNLYALIDGFCSNIFFLIFMCLYDPILGLPAIFVIYGFLKVRLWFSKPLKEMKKLDLQARSPMVSEISSTLHGLMIIRVYRQGAKFVQHFLHLVYNCARVTIFHGRMERFFSMSLFSMLYVLVMVGIFSFVYQATHGKIDPGLFGMAIYYLIAVGSNSIMATRQSLQSEIGMQNAENIMQYLDTPQEPPSKLQKDEELGQKNWPWAGEIVYNDIRMKYKETGGYALNGLTFKIEAGSKVGIVGRTGAGKSSIIQVLFRMAEIESIPGSSVMIDGINTKEVGLEFLRKNLAIIPQAPVIFIGTIRKNLDPFNQYTTEQLWESLAQVQLKEYIEKLEKGLETELNASGSVFSAGQKQLMCLARVILKKKKIMVFDEATANVDFATDFFVQEQMKVIFKDSTILTIAHRLTTIAHYDKVMVLETGKVAEYDHPYALLVERIGDEGITKKEGIFANMVLKSGDKVAQKIFETAKACYETRKKTKGTKRMNW